jgi:hypothetical protein
VADSLLDHVVLILLKTLIVPFLLLLRVSVV